MFEISVQTQNVILDDNPIQGFQLLRDKGFGAVDFSLNGYLKNTDLYKNKLNPFFEQSIEELEAYFTPHKEAAQKTGIRIHQMHMPYPNFIPTATDKVNDFLLTQMAPKSMQLCDFFGCKYIVVHGLKMKRYIGSEELEWQQTRRFLDKILPMAADMDIIVCIENLYESNGKHIVEGPCCNADKAAQRIDIINDEYGKEVLGFCFDTGHANLVGIDFESFITTLGSRIKVLHTHDNDGVADLHQLPFVFTKTRENTPSTDWNGFVAGLKKIQYEGTINFETAPVLKSFPEEMKGDALGMIAGVGRYFANQIGEM